MQLEGPQGKCFKCSAMFELGLHVKSCQGPPVQTTSLDISSDEDDFVPVRQRSRSSEVGESSCAGKQSLAGGSSRTQSSGSC